MNSQSVVVESCSSAVVLPAGWTCGGPVGDDNEVDCSNPFIKVAMGMGTDSLYTITVPDQLFSEDEAMVDDYKVSMTLSSDSFDEVLSSQQMADGVDVFVGTDTNLFSVAANIEVDDELSMNESWKRREALPSSCLHDLDLPTSSLYEPMYEDTFMDSIDPADFDGTTRASNEGTDTSFDASSHAFDFLRCDTSKKARRRRTVTKDAWSCALCCKTSAYKKVIQKHLEHIHRVRDDFQDYCVSHLAERENRSKVPKCPAESREAIDVACVDERDVKDCDTVHDLFLNASGDKQRSVQACCDMGGSDVKIVLRPLEKLISDLTYLTNQNKLQLLLQKMKEPAKQEPCCMGESNAMSASLLENTGTAASSCPANFLSDDGVALIQDSMVEGDHSTDVALNKSVDDTTKSDFMTDIALVRTATSSSDATAEVGYSANVTSEKGSVPLSETVVESNHPTNVDRSIAPSWDIANESNAFEENSSTMIDFVDESSHQTNDVLDETAALLSDAIESDLPPDDVLETSTTALSDVVTDPTSDVINKSITPDTSEVNALNETSALLTNFTVESDHPINAIAQDERATPPSDIANLSSVSDGSLISLDTAAESDSSINTILDVTAASPCDVADKVDDLDQLASSLSDTSKNNSLTNAVPDTRNGLLLNGTTEVISGTVECNISVNRISNRCSAPLTDIADKTKKPTEDMLDSNAKLPSTNAITACVSDSVILHDVPIGVQMKEVMNDVKTANLNKNDKAANPSSDNTSERTYADRSFARILRNQPSVKLERLKLPSARGVGYCVHTDRLRWLPDYRFLTKVILSLTDPGLVHACDVCCICFSDKKKLERHAALHVEVRTACSKCAKPFNKHSFRHCLRNHHGKPRMTKAIQSYLSKVAAFEKLFRCTVKLERCPVELLERRLQPKVDILCIRPNLNSMLNGVRLPPIHHSALKSEEQEAMTISETSENAIVKPNNHVDCEPTESASSIVGNVRRKHRHRRSACYNFVPFCLSGSRSGVKPKTPIKVVQTEEMETNEAATNVDDPNVNLLDSAERPRRKSQSNLTTGYYRKMHYGNDIEVKEMSGRDLQSLGHSTIHCSPNKDSVSQNNVDNCPQARSLFKFAEELHASELKSHLPENSDCDDRSFEHPKHAKYSLRKSTIPSQDKRNGVGLLTRSANGCKLNLTPVLKTLKDIAVQAFNSVQGSLSDKDSAVDSNSTLPAVAPIKRKRGRPRKYPVTVKMKENKSPQAMDSNGTEEEQLVESNALADDPLPQKRMKIDRLNGKLLQTNGHMQKILLGSEVRIERIDPGLNTEASTSVKLEGKVQPFKHSDESQHLKESANKQAKIIVNGNKFNTGCFEVSQSTSGKETARNDARQTSKDEFHIVKENSSSQKWIVKPIDGSTNGKRKNQCATYVLIQGNASNNFAAPPSKEKSERLNTSANRKSKLCLSLNSDQVDDTPKDSNDKPPTWTSCLDGRKRLQGERRCTENGHTESKKTLKCRFCCYETSGDQLRDHMSQKHATLQVPCVFCNRPQPLLSRRLEEHLRQHLTEETKKRIGLVNNLVQFFLRKGTVPDAKVFGTYCCSECTMVFSSQRAFEKHQAACTQ